MAYQVDILLATYNGEKFLSAQIDSLLNQTYDNWKLIIRDDLSSDMTVSVINNYRSRYPDRIYILDNQSVKQGIVGSFAQLLDVGVARYTAFCDQDDVWNHDKLLLQVEKMRELEAIHGESMPILIHTDLSVVNDQLDTISESFWKHQNIPPDKMSTLRRLLAQNCVTGCTLLINRPLAKLALPFPEEVIMHDWWLALVAASEGILCNIKSPTVKYRQHDNNDTGAKSWNLEFIFRSVFQGRESQLRNLLKTRAQAEALLSANILSGSNKKIVEKYVAMFSRDWVARRLDMIRMGFFKYGIIRNVAMFLRI